MIEHPKLASIECAQCSALIEVYPGSERGGPNLEWITPDEDRCKEPPIARCRYARADVARRFPGLIVGAPISRSLSEIGYTPCMGIDLDRADHAMPANDNGQDLFAGVPELPLPTERWNARRKATVVDAIRGGWIPVEEVCRLYSLSADEILAWERAVDQYGVAGLHIKQLQVHRQIRRRP